MNDKQLPALVSGVCFILLIIAVYTALVFSAGCIAWQAKTKTLYADPASPIIRQGELPYNVPVMLYKVLPDGRVTAESALRTDYAGVLPFSTTAHKVPFDQIKSWDYWTELSAVMKGQP